MKSLQEYLEIYRSIARNLNLRGDSVEMLSQMLANATFISEVEHIAYSQEASLERATLMNSKIQHCMNEMYSVFRGSCPRVILRFKANVAFEWNVFDEISSSNSFSVYYLGYYSDTNTDKSMAGTGAISDYGEFVYAPISIPPTDDAVEYTIIALISPKKVIGEWKLDRANTYYVDLLESNLSNDIMVKVNDSYHNITRVFADHIKDGSIFDLTIPDYGLRLYAPDIFRPDNFSLKTITETPTNTKISAEVFEYSSLDDYNQSELKSIKIKGAKLTNFPEEFINHFSDEISTGIILLSEVSRDTLATIHYKALRDRYTGSMIKSNSDIGTLLEETYPDKIRKSGTSFEFESLKTTKIENTDVSYQYSFVDNFTGSGMTYNGYVGKDSSAVLGSGVTIYGSADSPITIYHNGTGISPISYTPEFNNALEYKEAILLNRQGKFVDNQISGGIIKIPISGKGKLRILHKSSYNVMTSYTYDILPSISTISGLINNNGNKILTKSISINLVKVYRGGITEIISSTGILNEPVSLYYSIDDGFEQEVSGNKINLSNVNVTDKLTITLRDTSGLVLDEEVIPVVYSYSSSNFGDSKTSSETITDSSVEGIEKVTINTSSSNNQGNSAGFDLRLNLSNDLIFLETSESGEIITTFPIIISAGLYINGVLSFGDNITYEILKSSGIECTITNRGVLTITSISPEIKESSIILVRACYEGTYVTAEVTIKTMLALDAFKSRKIAVSDDKTGKTVLSEFDCLSNGTLSELEYNGKEDSLYIWLNGSPSAYIYSIEWIETVENVINIVDQENVSPSLKIYYIPQTSTSLLTDNEISAFIMNKGSYYVTHDIEIERGTAVNVSLNLGVELFQNSSIDEEVKTILEEYSYKFNIDLDNSISEIISTISKIVNVKKITNLSVSYKHELGYEIPWEEVKNNLSSTYFVVNYQINSVISI